MACSFATTSGVLAGHASTSKTKKTTFLLELWHGLAQQHHVFQLMIMHALATIWYYYFCGMV